VLGARLAALCARPERRRQLSERVLAALELEQAAIAGRGPGKRAGAEEALIEELSNYLRALLRDLICGHLAPDLVGLAEELLASPPEEGTDPAATAEPEAVGEQAPEDEGQEPSATNATRAP
jgi:hypothetical protein